MAFQPCPNIAEVALKFFWQGSYMLNIYHNKREGGFDVGSLIILWAAYNDFLTSASWKATAQSDCSFVGAHLVDLSTETGAVYDPPIAEPLPGTVTSTASPANATVAISMHTDLRGRSYRGRVYHIGLPQGKYVDSVLNGDYQAQLTTVYTALMNDCTDASMGLCVLSRRNGKALRGEGIGTLVRSISVDPVLDSQRRRLPGRGM